MRDEQTDIHESASIQNLLSSVSWAKDRLDVFGLAGNNLVHKFWDGSQWNPVGSKLEALGNGLATPPVAVSVNVSRLDVFGLDDHHVIKHQYFDGTTWQPNTAELNNLGGPCAEDSSVTVSSWGPGRLDLFCLGPTGDLKHQYYDGTQWQPSEGGLESLGGILATTPTAVSWGPNRLDIFALNKNAQVQHMYWDGSQWSAWETFDDSIEFQREAVTVKTWGENRLDIFARAVDNSFWHKYWDGSQWADWVELGGPENPLVSNADVTSWSTNHFDIVGLSQTGHYLYKFYDGSSWMPNVVGWYDKGPQVFASKPSLVSWGENRLDIFGMSIDGKLLHQAWTGYDWYPGNTEWECIAGCAEEGLLPVSQASIDMEL